MTLEFLAVDWFLLGRLIPETNVVADRLVLGVSRSAFVIALHFLIFHGLVHKLWPHRKITDQFPSGSDYRREAIYTFLGATLVSIPILLVNLALVRFAPWFELYFDVERHGLFYYWLSFPLFILGDDLYFYVLHRWLHSDFLYRTVHVVHHRSTNTNPLTGTSFHPLEAFIFYGYPVLVAAVVPIHFDVVNFLSWFTFIFVTYGHSGFDILPKLFRRRPMIYVWNGPLHHALHHREGRFNFSKYFNLWDSVFKTNHPGYLDEAARFDERVAAE